MTSKTRTIAGTELHPVGLGCMNLSWAYGTPPGREEGAELLGRALDLGYNHLDTARIYGTGANEALIGETLKGRRGEFFLASKCGITVDGPKRGVDCTPAAIEAAVDESLRLLQTDHIDLYYMHRFDPKVPIADSVGALARAIEAGKIGAYGVSEWSSRHIREAHAVHEVGAVQTEYSLWTRNVELAVLETCAELGVPLVAFSPVGRGALAGLLRDPATLEEQDLRTKMPRFNAENWPHNLELIDKLATLAKDAGMTAAQLALAWVLSRGEHVHVIPGTTNLQHLADNHAAWDLPVAQDLLDAAGALINEGSVAGHRYHDAIRPTIDTEEFEPGMTPETGTVRAEIGYSERTEQKPFFYANAHEKDFVPLKPAEVVIADARGLGCTLDREGFTLVEHTSAVADLTDLKAVSEVHRGEIVALLKQITGCDEVAMTPFGILRFSEKAGANDAHDNSHPARFVHVDMAKEPAAAMREKTAPPAPEGKTVVRSAQYNVWRSLAGGTQDVPLGLCAYPSVAREDLLDCDAIFDPLDGSPEWGFPNYLLAHNPAHRWYYYSNMTRDEAIVFKTSESDAARAQLMPHGAFDNPLAGADAPARISLEMRGTCYWYA